MEVNTITPGVHSTQPGRSPGRGIPEVNQWCACFETLCRERGIRVTPQRLAVYRVLAADTTHPTAESVYSVVKRQMTSMSFATVYRILQCLESKGLIRHVGAQNGASRYDANQAPHQHYVCRACGCMIDHEDASFSCLGLPKGAPDGFTAEELEIRILGICGKCREILSRKNAMKIK